jgi:tetratricopeptide (TPR) repeat protein
MREALGKRQQRSAPVRAGLSSSRTASVQRVTLLVLLVTLLSLLVPQTRGQQEEFFFPAQLHFTNNPKVRAAGLLMEQGEYRKAAEILEGVLEVTPKDSYARELLKESYLNLKEYENLEAFLREELRSDPASVQLKSELADLWLKQDRREEAVGLLEEALQQKAREINTYRLVADTYSRNRMFPEAIETYRRARRDLEKPYAFAFEIAGMHESLGQWREAAQEYLLYLRDDPKKLRSVSQRLSAIIETGADRGEVKSVLSSAIRENPKEVALYRLYGEILLEAGELDQALESYKICELLSDDKSTPLLDFSTKCLEYKSYRTALEAVDYLFDKKPPSGQLEYRALFSRAKAYQGLGESERAISAYREVVGSGAFAKLKAEATFAVAEIELYELKNPGRALQDFRKVVSEYPVGSYRLEAQLRSADCLLMMDDFEEASRLYQEVASRPEKSPVVEEARLRSGDLKLRSGDYGNARMTYGRLIYDFPKGFFINDCLERRFLLAELQDTSSSEIASLANLFLLEAQRRFEQALTFMESLQYPENSFVQDMISYRRASANRQLGKPSEALKSLDEIIERSPDGFYAPFSLLLKAKILAEDLGREEEAGRVYKEIMDDYGDSLVSEEARERLRALGVS